MIFQEMIDSIEELSSEDQEHLFELLPPAPSPKKGEGEPDQSPSPHLGEGFRVRAMNSYPTDRLLEKLRKLKPDILQKFRAKEIQLFGSYVRHEQRPDSDIDILVDFEEEADLFDLSGLAIFLEEQLNRPIDLVCKRSLRTELQEAILQEAVLI